MPNSNDTFERLRRELYVIKGDRTYQTMADECGLVLVTLWRIMKGERIPGGETLTTLLSSYPQLATLFSPSIRTTKELSEPIHGE